MNTSVNTISLNISGELYPSTSISYNKKVEISENNAAQLYIVSSFAYLKENWDSYGGKKPTGASIVKAMNFILKELCPRNLEVFFSAPTVDGDILVELKNKDCNLEFIFSGEVEDKIIASCDGNLKAEHILNETTLHSCLNWLYR